MPVITAQDALAIGFLVFLEGVLSIDNALVLALIVKPLPEKLRRRALTYGIAGAIVFRLIAISAAAWLIHWQWVKLVGGGYLVYLPVKYLLDRRRDEEAEAQNARSRNRAFWMTVLVVELTDILFAVDSILTAVALTSKVWVVMTGGVLGMLAMRVAAGFFVRLIERFPRFEPTAYFLVFLVGIKLLIEGLQAELGLRGIDFHDPRSPAFWGFWGAMVAGFGAGFLPPRGTRKKKPSH
jgi:YkoY family integral membrane protein